jgi:O-antigen ligase
MDSALHQDRFATGSALALGAVLVFSVLAFACRERWAETIFQVATLAIAMSWLGRWIIAPYPVRGCALLIPLAMTVLWGPAQLALNKSVYRFVTWNAVLSWSAYFLLFLLAFQIFSDRSLAWVFFRGALYFATGLSVLGTLQYLTSHGKIYWAFPTPWDAFGPFINYDHYAAFIELLLPLAILEAIRERRAWIHGAMLGILYGSVIATASRAGVFLATLEILAVPLIAVRRGWAPGRLLGRRLMMMAAAIILCGTAAGWQGVWGRFHSNLFEYRRQMWVSTLQMVRDRPGFGFGLGTFETAYPAYALFDEDAIVNHAHNDWAEWAAEGGVPFLLILASIVGLSFRAALRSIWGLGPLVVLVHSLVDFPMQTPAIAAWVFVFLAGVATREKAGQRDPGRSVAEPLEFEVEKDAELVPAFAGRFRHG